MAILKSDKIVTFSGKHVNVFARGMLNATEYPLRGLQTVGGWGNTMESGEVRINGNLIDQTHPNATPKSLSLVMFRWTYEKVMDLYNYDALVAGVERLTITCQHKHLVTGDVVGWVARDCIMVEDGGDDDLNSTDMSLVTLNLKPTAFERLGISSSTSLGIRINLTL